MSTSPAPARARSGSRRRTAKEWLWNGVYRSGLYELVRSLHRRHLLVLTYHGVLRDAGSSFLNRNCVSTAVFAQQLEFLRSHYRLVTLREALDSLTGRSPLPDYAALLTFDDGFRNNYRLALPILRAHGAPAAVFVTTGMLDKPGQIPWIERVSLLIVEGGGRRLDLSGDGVEFHFSLATRAERVSACNAVRRHLKSAPTAERNRYLAELERQCGFGGSTPDGERFEFLDWEEARALVADGVEIGSHTVGHYCLAPLEPSELHQEVQMSKLRIEEMLGRPCVAFAYPDGEPGSFGDRDRRALLDAGYEAAFTQIPGYNAPGCDPYTLHRFNVPGGEASLAVLIATISGVRRRLRRR